MPSEPDQSAELMIQRQCGKKGHHKAHSKHQGAGMARHRKQG